MLTLSIITTLAAVVVYYIYGLFKSFVKHLQHGNKFPGPKPWPIVGNIFNFKHFGVDAIPYYEKIEKLYGPTYRLWIAHRLQVFVSEPEDVQVLLSSNVLINKSPGYSILKSWFGSGLLISSDKLWRIRRRALNPSFHFKQLEGFLPIVNKCANTFVNCLRERSDKGAFDIDEYASNCTLDCMAETSLQVPVNAQEDKGSEFVKATISLARILATKMCNPICLLEPYYTLSGMRRNEKNSLSALNNFYMKVIKSKENKFSPDIITNQSRMEENELGLKKKTAFLEFMLERKHQNDPAFSQYKDILDETATFMFGGHDTTATAISFTLWLLGCHQKVQDAVYAEVSEILLRGEPQTEDLNNMKLLERVIKESLRLFPPVPYIARLLEHDVVLPSSGLVIPKGSTMGVNIIMLHRRATLYPNPTKFDPDRFLPEACSERHLYAYILFSAGSRNCIGQKLAMQELKIIISKVIYNYQISSDGKDLITSPHLVLRSKEGVIVTLKKRNKRS